ncbi:TetR/AcrR family transcriptional regulator [Microlunatus parietis]|uniref:AcrR family transcriptional regulator n=1 Tax=Microlunatus parietis TaxID=682979 RepID=A0A7Y9LDA2_9ACTN|nr:TetR/AcrR family transcriptional regulator [Microlunatus parietis]NYE73682.1 AcrR family transcriptional regulator [Microlunatus parietis]
MVRPGRPRNSSIDGELLQALAELVAEHGYTAVTVDQVVRRAGTNKPAFYRRFPDLAAAVPVLLASRYGIDEDIDTGSLVGDLVEVQRRQLRLFTDPAVTRGLLGWAAEVDADPARGESFVADYLRPRRAHAGILIDRAVTRGEIEPGADPDWIADLLTGPLALHVVMPGLPAVDDRLIARTVHAALDALGFGGDRGQV